MCWAAVNTEAEYFIDQTTLFHGTSEKREMRGMQGLKGVGAVFKVFIHGVPWRSENKLKEPVFSFYRVGSSIQLRSSGLAAAASTC